MYLDGSDLMGFRANLQHLRASKGMTQEQLAMLLGVSRQSVSKWESEAAYPEMDKLLKICNIFECSLEELVQGDLTGTPLTAQQAPAPASDAFGYDQQRLKQARRIALGVFWIITGVAFGILLSGEALSVGHEVLSLVCIFAGVLLGVGLIVLGSMEFNAFRKAHPYLQDFYTESQRQTVRRQLVIGLVLGIGFVFAGVVAMLVLEGQGMEDLGTAIMLFLVAIGACALTFSGMAGSRTDIEDYNLDNMAEGESLVDAACYDETQRVLVRKAVARRRATGAACGAIMIIATVIALGWLFLGMDNPDTFQVFWIPWALGGVLCAITGPVYDMFHANR